MEDCLTIYFDGRTFGDVDLSWIGLAQVGDLLMVRLRFFQKGLALNVGFDHYEFRIYKEVSKKILRQIDSNYFGDFNQLSPFATAEIDVPAHKFSGKNMVKSFFAEDYLLNMIAASSESRLISLHFRETPFCTIQYFLLI